MKKREIWGTESQGIPAFTVQGHEEGQHKDNQEKTGQKPYSVMTFQLRRVVSSV